MSNHPDNPLQLPEHIKAMPEDEKRARKAWLKKKFGSFEYHEEMLRLHHGFVETLRRALARAVHDDSPDPDYGTKAAFARNFEKTYWPLIQANDDLGKIPREEWHRIRHAATFRSIPDYSRYLLSEGDALAWLNEHEHLELGRYWGPMARMAQNIAYTVDERWEEDPDDRDWILDEKYTGPITWPENWREELAEPVEAAPRPPSTPAGQPCPRTGWWFTPAQAHSRRRFQAGEVMPDFPSDWGQVIWQWDEQQAD
ncbi:MAG: hypothetical protein KatS3mg122_1899 [Caldimonas sp.]|nr:MAG: hypothetical protein KatS3mg122_1899 [Caldimonas sp.]